MTLKLCLALAFAGAPIAMPASDPVYVHMDAVKQVDCANSLGTAFRVGPGAYVSVNHVVDDIACRIEGEAVNVTLVDAWDDFASLRTRRFGIGLKINCEGFKDGETYFAVGYAGGKPLQRGMFVQASSAWTLIAPWNGFQALVGKEKYIPGMSGGPVLNSKNEVVGTVNGYHRFLPLSFSQPLKDTAICGA